MNYPPIFLSASIPLPDREFQDDVELKRIRDAILALVTVCRDQERMLVFGGHPAISPLVHHAANSLAIINQITIYQSELYKDRMPQSAKEFPQLEWTEAGQDDKSSQSIMRDAMINPERWQFTHAVFIGGMNGIFDEAIRFHKNYPEKPMIPLQYTGGATRHLREFLDSHFLEVAPPRPAWLIPEKEETATSMPRYRRVLSQALSRSFPDDCLK